jgi:DNA damage-binding protein 1
MDDISAISCLPLDPKQNSSQLIAVGFWGSNHVRILRQVDAPALREDHKTDRLPALPRSLLLYNFGTNSKKKSPDYHAHLLIGLADGSMVSFAYTAEGLKDKKVVPLGTSPVSLVPTEANRRKSIFCCGTRASVVFWDRDRLQNAPALLKVI